MKTKYEVTIMHTLRHEVVTQNCVKLETDDLKVQCVLVSVYREHPSKHQQTPFTLRKGGESNIKSTEESFPRPWLSGKGCRA